jgi:histone H3/H4
MDGETGELRDLMDRRQAGQSDDIGPSSSPGTTGEPTFLFRIPERTRNSLLPPATEEQDEEEDELAPAIEEVEPQFEDNGYEDVYDDDEAISAPLRRDSPALEETRPQTKANKSATRARKEVKVSRYGIEYPSLPPTVIKRLASTFARSYGGTGRLDKETLTAISQTSDWFFEQISEDLASYADHAGRKTIEESDVVTLMKRYVVSLILCIHAVVYECYLEDTLCGFSAYILYIANIHFYIDNASSTLQTHHFHLHRNFYHESFYKKSGWRRRVGNLRSGRDRGWRRLMRSNCCFLILCCSKWDGHYHSRF